MIDFRNVGVWISVIAFEGVLSKSEDSPSKGFNISLLEVLGWVASISIKGLVVGLETFFSFSL